MEFIYSILDVYLEFWIKLFWSFGMDKKNAEVFGTFISYIPIFYYSVVIMWLTAGGDYLEDVDKTERVFVTIAFSFLVTGMTYLLRGFGETSMSSGYFLFGFIAMLASTLQYMFNVTVIADGINKSKKG